MAAAAVPVGVLAKHRPMLLAELRFLEKHVAHVPVQEARNQECTADIDFHAVSDHKKAVLNQCLNDTREKLERMLLQFQTEMPNKLMDAEFIDIVTLSPAIQQEVDLVSEADCCLKDIWKIGMEYIPESWVDQYCASEIVCRDKMFRTRSSQAGDLGWMKCTTSLQEMPWTSIDKESYRLVECGELQEYKDDSEIRNLRWRRGFLGRELVKSATMGGMVMEVRVASLVYQNSTQKFQLIIAEYLDEWCTGFSEELKSKIKDHAVRATALEGSSHYRQCFDMTWSEEVGQVRQLSKVARYVDAVAKRARTGVASGSAEVDTSILAQLTRQR